jgi:hypothetical protein
LKKHYVLQLLRGGTSIGSNVEEAIGGSSKKILYISLRLLIVKQEKQIIG